jgi:hypothetical protein
LPQDLGLMYEQQVIVGRLCVRMARLEHVELLRGGAFERHRIEPRTPAERVGREAVGGDRGHAASRATRVCNALAAAATRS